ncbi:MAG: CHAT domain-containing protein [Acidobacteriota bacterium]|nr:CHAT domain-containing protein [Acidobacteriota bacterium]
MALLGGAVVLLPALIAGCGGSEPEVPYPAVVRGHQEVVLEPGADGGTEAVPLFLDPGVELGLCLQVPATVDTTAWRGSFALDGRTLGPAVPPSARVATTVCFEVELPRSAAGTGALELCGWLEDGSSGEVRSLPCQALRLEDRPQRQGIQERLNELLGTAGARPVAELTADLDRLTAVAEEALLPELAVRIELIAVHFLSLAGERTEASERLDTLPRWLHHPALSRRAAQVAYLRGQIALLDGRRREAWQAFEEADALYLRVADPTRFTVAMQRAALLSDAGAGHEAVEHLRGRLDECRVVPCDPALLAAGRLQVARLVLNDPFRTRDDLEAARQGLVEYRSGLPQGTGVAALLVEAALQLELGEDPAPTLTEARRLGASQAGPAAEASQPWIRWLEGQAALARGDSDRALEECRRMLDESSAPAAAWAWSCIADAYRRQERFAAADLAYAKTLALHEGTAGESLGLSVVSGLGRQAEDVLRAAQVAVDLGAAERAWRLLDHLDRRSAHEGERRRCRQSVLAAASGATGESLRWAAEWRRIDGEIEELLGQLTRLELPASLAREAESAPLQRALQERLLTLWRTWPGCDQPRWPAGGGADYRAFAVDDEVILLRRIALGKVVADQRTPLAREELTRLTEEVTVALRRRDLDDQAWRRLLAPAAAALLPRNLADLEPVTTFALHGRLQLLPLAALPLPEGAWLGERTVVALQPAGAGAGSPAAASAARPGLFVVDPLGDLPHARRSAEAYGARFPGATILERGAASRRALEQHLGEAGWLHLDTHARYEPAFPELSSLALADGPLRFVELAALPAPGRFANLSGCRTAAWHPTADSGRYGLGGLMARLGTPWTVATRAPLPDRSAEVYNRAFYAAVAAGIEAPKAHGQALAELRKKYPAAAWGALLLLHAPEFPSGLDQSPASPEPASEPAPRKIPGMDS